MSNYNPTNKTNRIISLDLIRGFALLGILIMNIISFANVGVGYLNPILGAGLKGANAYVHAFGFLFADIRFMSIFSMLFGAGIMLFADNISKKGGKARSFHYKRMFLLLLFGLMHAYLIWMGDILVAYALCGCIVFFMRKWKLRTLSILAFILFIIPILFSLLTYFGTPKEHLAEIFSFWTPSDKELTKEITAYRGTYLNQMQARITGAIKLQTIVFLMEQMWRICSMMLLGIILYRKGILSGTKSVLYYRKLFIIGMPVALLISIAGLYRSYQNNWEGVWVMNIGHLYTYVASLIMALAYIALIVLWSKSKFLKQFQIRLMAVGRMAFTNYILSSLNCTFIFYGHGLGLFAKIDRLEQWGIIIGVWALLLFMSPLILKKYKQGPLEWLWRKLTYL